MIQGQGQGQDIIINTGVPLEVGYSYRRPVKVTTISFFRRVQYK
jgi:hypothetical protein